MNLTRQNYHSPEANLAYWSNSQFAECSKCPARFVAGIRGEYKRKPSPALAFGQWFDRALTAPDELDDFLSGPESLDEDGKSYFIDAKGRPRDNKDVRSTTLAIARAKADPMLAQGLKTWQKQVIFTGEIAGYPWKVMADLWIPENGGTVPDLKLMADFDEEWTKGDGGKNVKAPWYDAWGYFRSMATYRDVIRQNTGTAPLVLLFAFTKQEPPDCQTVRFDSPDCEDRFIRELENITALLPGFDRYKTGVQEAPGCDEPDCEYCRGRHTLENVVDAVSSRVWTVDR